MAARRSLNVLGAAIMVLIAAPAAAIAQSNCQWYATTALKQQQDNERLRCGFTGPAWNTDMKAHIAWCASVSPEAWRQSAQQRDQELAACAAKKR